MKKRELLKGLNTSMKWLWGLLFLTMAVSCDSDDEQNALNGKVRLLLTDAPIPIDTVENAFVTLDKIELRKEEADDDDDDDRDDDGSVQDDDSDNGRPFIVVMEESKTFNLVDLRNGVTEELTLIDIPAGSYDLVRMYISDASLELKGGAVYDLKIPSGSSSGLKIFIDPPIVVEGGITEELLLDFDLSRSLVPKGSWDDIQGFNFTPVIRAVNVSAAGRIEGTITDDRGQPVAGAAVEIEKDDDVVSVTFSEESGYYALAGVPQGSYEIEVEAEGYDSFSLDDVSVTAGNKTVVDVSLTESTEDD